MNNEQDTQKTLPTSPDWSTAPLWAEWFAIDEDGKGFWYADEPRITSIQWVLAFDDLFYAGKFDATNWQNSLQQRPQQ